MGIFAFSLPFDACAKLEGRSQHMRMQTYKQGNAAFHGHTAMMRS